MSTQTQIDRLRNALAGLVDRDTINALIETDRQGIKDRQKYIRYLCMVREAMRRQSVSQVADLDLAVLLDEVSA